MKVWTATDRQGEICLKKVGHLADFILDVEVIFARHHLVAAIYGHATGSIVGSQDGLVLVHSVKMPKRCSG